MPCKPGVAGSIPGFSIKPLNHIKPLSVSLRVLPSYNKHTNHKPSRQYWFLPRESHKKFLTVVSGVLLNTNNMINYDSAEKYENCFVITCSKLTV